MSYSIIMNVFKIILHVGTIYFILNYGDLKFTNYFFKGKFKNEKEINLLLIKTIYYI